MASPFASLTTSDSIPLPFDPGQWVRVRKLTGREIEAAQDSHRSQFASGTTKAWAATFRRALEHGATDPEVIKALADPLTGYDRFEVVRAGLVSWSYPQTIEREKPASRSQAIDDLDDEAVDFIAREVLRLTKPALFQTQDEAETERKNATGSSTAA